tara:strand:+ start:972 stop:1139 length:168 start_codon:yes stop_codon:yes gene_type:complete
MIEFGILKDDREKYYVSFYIYIFIESLESGKKSLNNVKKVILKSCGFLKIKHPKD